jgi:dienelactone hydrolase
MADKLCGLAEEDEARGRLISAGDKYKPRGHLPTSPPNALQAHGAPAALELYQRFLDVFARGVKLSGENCERVEIPYGDAHLSGLYVAPKACRAGADPGAGQRPGFDQGDEVPRRPAGVAGQARRVLAGDRPARHRRSAAPARHARAWPTASAGPASVVDWLETRADVDPKRIGLEGVSLGGYYCPRAVAFEPRFACGVVWGANHDWRDVQKKRLAKEGSFPVPHYWEHVRWVWGAKDMDDFMRIAENVHLDGVLDRIKVPFLVTHGEKDSQIPLHWAERTYEQLVNSPKRELKVFTEREGGVQHSSFDNRPTPAPTSPTGSPRPWAAAPPLNHDC